MRFSDLRPCDGCGEGLGLTFLRVDVTREVVDPAEARKRIGLDVMFLGAPKLAAAFHDPDDATKAEFTCRALLCVACGAQLLAHDGIVAAIESAQEGARP